MRYTHYVNCCIEASNSSFLGCVYNGSSRLLSSYDALEEMGDNEGEAMIADSIYGFILGVWVGFAFCVFCLAIVQWKQAKDKVKA